MQHPFQFPSNDSPFANQSQSDTVQTDDYCEEITKDGKKHHSCTFPNCGKIFRFKSEFVRHKLTHNPQRHLDCPHAGCTKTFKREDALQNHMRIHTGEMPFQCEIPGCEQSFPTKAGLRYHYLKHKGEKECRCSFPGCNKTFLTLSQLKQHESTVNYHQKIIPQTPVSELPVVKKVKTETVKIQKGKNLFLEYVEPEVKQLETLEWGFKDQADAEVDVDVGVPSFDLGNDLQSNFERMVKMISTENTAMKNKIDMCNTLMVLMQENKELKSKLNKASEYENLVQAPVQDSSDDKIFSFLDFNSPDKNKQSDKMFSFLNFNSPVKNNKQSFFDDGFFSFDI